MTESENIRAAFAAAASSLLKIHEDWMDSNHLYRGELPLAQWMYEFSIMRVASGRAIGHTTWITSVITDADYLVVPNRTVGKAVYRQVKNVVYIPQIERPCPYPLFKPTEKRNRIFIDCCGYKIDARLLHEITAMLRTETTIVVVS